MTPNDSQIENLKVQSEILIDEGQLEHAAEVLEQLILILEKPQTADRDLMISSLEGLGACYFGMQQYEKTISVYSRLVVNLDEKFGMDHLDTIKAVYKLAKSCEKAGQREQAKTMFYIAKESALKNLSEDHYLRQSILESYHSAVKPKRVVESVNSFVVGDLHEPKEIVKAAKSLPATFGRLATRWDVIASIVCTLVLIAGSGLWVMLELERKHKAVAVATSTKTTANQSFKYIAGDENTFSTTDGLLSLRMVTNKECQFECGQNFLNLPVVTLTDSLDSISKVMDRRDFGARVWAEANGGSISLDGQLKLFRANSTEMKLAAACRSVANSLNEYYRKNNSYPDAKADIVASGHLSYINPLTGKSQSVSYQNFSQFMQLSHLFNGVKSIDDVANYLRKGGLWLDVSAFIPGEIHCVSRYSGEKIGENFVVPNAFIHAADEKRELLPGDMVGETFVLSLEKGNCPIDSYQQQKLNRIITKMFQGRTLYFVKSQGLFTNVWLFKNCTTIVLAFLFFLAICWWFIFDARARLEDKTSLPKISEIIMSALGVTFIGWVIASILMQ